MEELPSNSKKDKPGKAKKLVTSKPIRRKKSLLEKFRDTFVEGTAQSATEYITDNIVVPAIKDVLFDASKSFLETLIFGGPQRSHRSDYRHVGSTRSYQSYGDSYRRESPREDRREPSDRRRSRHNFDDIVIRDRTEALEIVEFLKHTVDEYGAVYVSDLLETIGETSSTVDRRWGWEDLSRAGVTRVRDGYLLDLPRPRPI